MAKTSPRISKAEMDVLRVLWDHGAGTVREVAEHLPPGKKQWAYTTLQTLLNRLEAKGYVSSDKRAVPNVFRPSVTRESLMRKRLRTLIDDLCDGAALPVAMALVKDKKFSKDDVRAFRRLLEDLDSKKE